VAAVVAELDDVADSTAESDEEGGHDTPGSPCQSSDYSEARLAKIKVLR